MSDWIEWHWTPEKIFPETLDTEVYVRFRDGTEMESPTKVRSWFHANPKWSLWHTSKEPSPDDITHYRVVEAA